MSARSDAAYYAQLEAGALYLADQAGDPAAKAEHLEMARIYALRARDLAEPAAAGTVH